jgi:hypothetical protein
MWKITKRYENMLKMGGSDGDGGDGMKESNGSKNPNGKEKL